MKELLVIIKSNKVVCTSLQVAESFDKRHDNVIRDIEAKILGIVDNAFTHLKIEVSKYKDESGKRCGNGTGTNDPTSASGFERTNTNTGR